MNKNTPIVVPEKGLAIIEKTASLLAITNRILANPISSLPANQQKIKTALRLGYTGEINSVSFSPGGRTIVSGSGDRTIRLWDVRSGEELQQSEGHTGWVTSVSFSPDGHTIVSASKDKTVRIWDVRNSEELQRFEGHTRGIM